MKEGKINPNLRYYPNVLKFTTLFLCMTDLNTFNDLFYHLSNKNSLSLFPNLHTFFYNTMTSIIFRIQIQPFSKLFVSASVYNLVYIVFEGY